MEHSLVWGCECSPIHLATTISTTPSNGDDGQFVRWSVQHGGRVGWGFCKLKNWVPLSSSSPCASLLLKVGVVIGGSATMGAGVDSVVAEAECLEEDSNRMKKPAAAHLLLLMP